MVCLRCLWSLLLNPMLPTQYSQMAFPKNGNIICEPIQISVNSCPLLSLPFANISYLHWFPIPLMIWNMNCLVYLYLLEVWGFVILVKFQLGLRIICLKIYLLFLPEHPKIFTFSFFYSHSTTNYSFLFYCVNDNITMQEWLYIIYVADYVYWLL